MGDYCDATDGSPTAPLRCDLPVGHRSRHKERFVATWERLTTSAAASDVRWFDAATRGYAREASTATTARS